VILNTKISLGLLLQVIAQLDCSHVAVIALFFQFC